MNPAALDLVGVFVLGLSVGLTACAASCLPFIGTWAFARADGGWTAGGDLAAFMAGRLAGYGLLGAAAGLAGETLLAALNGPTGHLAIGGAGVIAGLALLTAGRPHAPCRMLSAGLSPAVLGLALSLTPCVPLATLLAAAAMGGSPAWGAAMGVLFGLGAAVTPMVLLVPLLGVLGNGVARQSGLGRWLRLGGGGVLIALSLHRLSLGW